MILGDIYVLIGARFTRWSTAILKLLNFAHGDEHLIGVFIGFGVLTLLGGPLGPVIWLSCSSSACLSWRCSGARQFLGVVIERFALPAAQRRAGSCC